MSEESTLAIIDRLKAENERLQRQNRVLTMVVEGYQDGTIQQKRGPSFEAVGHTETGETIVQCNMPEYGMTQQFIVKVSSPAGCGFGDGYE